MSLDRAIDELFDVPPDRFIAARDQLARRLTGEGEKGSAAEVKGLRKPTLIAWALNQLSRRHRQELEALIGAGDQLRNAQRKALSGVSGGDFKATMKQRRKLVQELTHLALEILAEAGKGPPSAEEEIGRTLEAVSSDPQIGDLVLRGRLAKPITMASGFDVMPGLSLVEDATATEAADRKARQASTRNAERQAEKAAADARRARIRADTLSKDLEELSRRARDAVRLAERLELDAETAQRRLEDARSDRKDS